MVESHTHCGAGLTNGNVGGRNLGGGKGGEGSRCHKDVVGCRRPRRMGVPLRVTIEDVLVKVAEQPESHSCPMDNKLSEAKEGNKWTDVAEMGRDGKLIFAV